VELFLTVFLGGRGRGRAGKGTCPQQVPLIGLAAVSQRSQLYYSAEYCTRLEVTQCLDLSLLDNILLFYLFFYPDRLPSRILLTPCDVYKTGVLVIVLQVEHKQIEQVKYDHRQKRYVVIDDL
jgi:hypothetical protein